MFIGTTFRDVAISLRSLGLVAGPKGMGVSSFAFKKVEVRDGFYKGDETVVGRLSAGGRWDSVTEAASLVRRRRPAVDVSLV